MSFYACPSPSVLLFKILYFFFVLFIQSLLFYLEHIKINQPKMLTNVDERNELVVKDRYIWFYRLINNQRQFWIFSDCVHGQKLGKDRKIWKFDRLRQCPSDPWLPTFWPALTNLWSIKRVVSHNNIILQFVIRLIRIFNVWLFLPPLDLCLVKFLKCLFMVPMNSLRNIFDQLIINLKVKLFQASDILTHCLEALLY